MRHQRTPSRVTPAYLLLLAATVDIALIAGLYYGWSCSVIPGLHRLDDGAYVEAMNAMDRAIINPVFFLSFFGAALLLPIGTYLHRGTPRFLWLLAASAVYIVASLGVTMFGNVPLNDALGAVDPHAASAADLARHRAAFEGPWVRLHTVRTWATVASLALAVIACLAPAHEHEAL